MIVVPVLLRLNLDISQGLIASKEHSLEMVSAPEMSVL
jgi:hypothetical protein